MKALIFMLVSGFILCLPHSQAIAANSVCQKVCAGGDQKCLDCCAENYDPLKQVLIENAEPCPTECDGVNGMLLPCIEQCHKDRKKHVFRVLRQTCNPDTNNEDEYKANKDRLYRVCLHSCDTAAPISEITCHQNCRRILTDW